MNYKRVESDVTKEIACQVLDTNVDGASEVCNNKKERRNTVNGKSW